VYQQTFVKYNIRFIQYNLYIFVILEFQQFNVTNLACCTVADVSDFFFFNFQSIYQVYSNSVKLYGKAWDSCYFVLPV